MNIEGFIIDTTVCMVELKGELPIGFYEPMDEITFATMISQVDVMFADKFDREMSIQEKQFVQLLFWQTVGKPFVAFFSMLEQWMYWVAINNDKLWEQVEMIEGENDEN